MPAFFNFFARRFSFSVLCGFFLTSFLVSRLLLIGYPFLTLRHIIYQRLKIVDHKAAGSMTFSSTIALQAAQKKGDFYNRPVGRSTYPAHFTRVKHAG
jgi:hypothetical protein